MRFTVGLLSYCLISFTIPDRASGNEPEGLPVSLIIRTDRVEVLYSDKPANPPVLESKSRDENEVSQPHNSSQPMGGSSNDLCGLDPLITQGGTAMVGTCAGAANECTNHYGLMMEAERDVGAAGYADESEYHFCKKYDCRSRYFKICSAIQVGFQGEMISPEEQQKSCTSKGPLSQPKCASAAAGLTSTLQAISSIASDPAPNNEEVKNYHVAAVKMPTFEDCQKQTAQCKLSYEAALKENPQALNDADQFNQCAAEFRNQFHVTFGSMCNDMVLSLRGGLRSLEFLYQKRHSENQISGMCEQLAQLCNSNYRNLLKSYSELGTGKYKQKCEPEVYSDDLGSDCQTARDFLVLGIGESNLKPDSFFTLETNNCRRIEVQCGDKFPATREKLLNDLNQSYQGFTPGQ